MKKYDPILLLIVFSGLLLRCYHLGTFGLSIDEMTSVGFASLPISSVILSDTNPPLYHLLLKAWLSQVPHTEFWIRAPSFIISSVTLFIFSFSLVPNSRKELRWLVATAFAFSPLSLQHAHEARMNVLWEFFTVLSLSFNVQRRLALARIAGIGSISSHWFALESQFLLETGQTSLSNEKKRFIWYSVGSGIFAIAVVVALNFSSFHLNWQIHRYSVVPFLSDFLEHSGHIFGHTTFFLFFIVVGIFDRSKEWIFTVYYVGTLILLSLFLERSLYLDRYLTPVVPVASLGLAVLVKNWSRYKLFTFFLFLSCSFSWGLSKTFNRPQEVWREALISIALAQPTKVFTSRSRMVAFPYLSSRGIELSSVQNYTEAIEEMLKLPKNGVFAYVDNYWGALIYWNDLKRDLQQNGFQLQETHFAERTKEPIRTLIIRRL